MRTRVKDRAIPDEGGKASHTTKKPAVGTRRVCSKAKDIPVKLVDHDGAECLFTVFSADGFYLGERSERRETRRRTRHAFSISFGMSSARRSLRETGFAEVERRAAGKAERRREGRD